MHAQQRTSIQLIKRQQLSLSTLKSANNNNIRFFSSRVILQQQQTQHQESHNDFKPKSKLTDSEIMEKKMAEYQVEIDKEVNEHPIFLYMKGKPHAPQCGFSRAVISVLTQYGYEFGSDDMNANVLKKEALKKYSDWPTIPQLFVKGELLGGCDIVVGLHRDGELEQILKDSGAKKLE